jgi:hypothetical protein
LTFTHRQQNRRVFLPASSRCKITPTANGKSKTSINAVMLMTAPLLSLGDIETKKSICTVARCKKMRSVAKISQIQCAPVGRHRKAGSGFHSPSEDQSKAASRDGDHIGNDDLLSLIGWHGELSGCCTPRTSVRQTME